MNQRPSQNSSSYPDAQGHWWSEPSVTKVPTGEQQQQGDSSCGNRRSKTNKKQVLTKEIADHALQLAESDIESAMNFLQQQVPILFLKYQKAYLSTCNYVFNTTQRDNLRMKYNKKVHVWPQSFPTCTPKLREAVNRWIEDAFSSTGNRQCLVLIGQPNTGKTSFALSLPGDINYYHDRWSLDRWRDDVRYSVYDGIPWDDFEKRGFPPKKSLLTQQQYTVQVTDRHRPTTSISPHQPSIVILHPNETGSLLAKPVTFKQKAVAEYWNVRAFVYNMGSDEYFHRGQDNTVSMNTGNKEMDIPTFAESPDDESVYMDDEFRNIIKKFSVKNGK